MLHFILNQKNILLEFHLNRRKAKISKQIYATSKLIINKTLSNDETLLSLYICLI
jgi:hypothetical protein